MDQFVKKEWEMVSQRIRHLCLNHKRVLVCIDGRCGSGKSTFAAYLHQELGCNVIHMDDFYLPMADRSADWIHHSGGNMDFLRLRQQILEPVLCGETLTYQAYDCALGCYREPCQMIPTTVTVFEGSYSMHPDLGIPANMRIFITCEEETQHMRLRNREGLRYSAFASRWIPMEERYFTEFGIADGCDIILKT